MRRINSTLLIAVLTLIAVVAVATPTTIESKTSAVSVLSIGLIAVSFIIESFKPFRNSWNTSSGDPHGDIAPFAGVFVIRDGTLKLLVPLLAIALFGGNTNNQTGLPLPVEILLTTLVIELGAWLPH